MKVLNLVYPEKSDIKYTIQKFPDGQQNITNISFLQYHKRWDSDYKCDYIAESVQIKSRLNNWLDLELIVCTVASLRELGIEEIHLYTPYIVGARSDRKFEEGGNNYIKDVIAPVINSLNFKSVTCIDPHSDVLEACIKGFRKESNLELIRFSLFDLLPGPGFINPDILNNIILVSPDAGASKKIYKLAEQINYKGDIITCSKDRDKDGKLTKCVVPLNDRESHDFIIIDDICDGGATFINIAKEIKEKYKGLEDISSIKIYLIVTHGIFSKGFGELQQYFDGIYCTNSYKDIIKSENYKGVNFEDDFVKQLNVY